MSKRMTWEEALEHAPAGILTVGIDSKYCAPLRDVLPRFGWRAPKKGREEAMVRCSCCDKVYYAYQLHPCDEEDYTAQHGGMIPGYSYFPRTNLLGILVRSPGTGRGHVAVCPKCHKAIIVKSVNDPSKKREWQYRTSGRAITWHKSRKDPQHTLVAVIADGDINERYTDDTLRMGAATHYSAAVSQIAVITYGGPAVRYYLQPTFPYSTCHTGSERWDPEKDYTPIPMSQCVSACYGNVTGVDEQSWIDAIRGTSWEWLMDVPEVYDDLHITTAARAAAFPAAEYMYKRGWDHLAIRYLNGAVHHLNPRGRSIAKVLKLPEAYWKRIRSQRRYLDPEILYAMQMMADNGVPADRFLQTLDQFEALSTYDVSQLGVLVRESTRAGVDRAKAIMYCAARRVHPSDYCDHLRMLINMHAVNMEDEHLMFPPHFPEAHRELTRRYTMYQQAVEAERKALEAETIGAVVKKYGPRVDFAHGRFAMRLFRTPWEITEEGALQRNCVGTYVRSYSNGRTLIGTLRLRDEPDVPRYTVEISPVDGRIVQCRGYANDRDEETRKRNEAEHDEVKAFWDAWKQHWDKVVQAEKRKQRAAKKADGQKKGA